MKKMTSNIEDLFGQIVSSEQRARQRKSQINAVKTQIWKCDAEMKDAEEDVQRFQGQMVLKAQKYNDLELQVNWEINQQKIIDDQRIELKKDTIKLQQDLHQLEADLEGNQKSFIDDVKSFCSGYDLISNGLQNRQTRWENDIEMLKKREKQLESEFSSYHQHESDLEIISTQNAEQIVAIETWRTKIQDLKMTLTSEKQKLATLEAEKQDVYKAPHIDPEFKKLQSELSLYKSSDLESTCVSLEQELLALQRHQWQKKIQWQADKNHLLQHTCSEVQRPPQSSHSAAPSSMVITNHSYPRMPQKPVASHVTAPNQHMVLQPWEELVEPLGADVPSGDQSVQDSPKRPVNLNKLSSAVKERDNNTDWNHIPATKESANQSKEEVAANQGSKPLTNQMQGNSSDEPMAKQQRMWRRQQLRQQQFQQQGLRRQTGLSKK